MEIERVITIRMIGEEVQMDEALEIFDWYAAFLGFTLEFLSDSSILSALEDEDEIPPEEVNRDE